MFVELFPGSCVVTLAGRDLHIPAPTLDDWAGVIAYVRSQIPNPLPELMKSLADLPKELAVEIFREANSAHQTRITIGPEDGFRYAFSSPAGFARLLWILLERNQPGVFSASQIFGAVADKAATSPHEYAADIEKVCGIAGLPKFGRQLGEELRGKAPPPTGNESSGPSAPAPNVADSA